MGLTYPWGPMDSMFTVRAISLDSCTSDLISSALAASSRIDSATCERESWDRDLREACDRGGFWEPARDGAWEECTLTASGSSSSGGARCMPSRYNKTGATGAI